MKQRLIIGILSVICIILLGLFVAMYLQQDRDGPVITLNDAIETFTEGDDVSVLLEGVTAYDQSDGDVTDTLFIERVIPSADGQSAKVIYAARDRSNNITKKEIVVSYIKNNNSYVLQNPTEDTSDTDGIGDTGDANIAESGPTDEDDLMINTDTTPLVSTGVPVIRLKQYKAIINVGGAFNPLSFVESAVDDKDYASTRIQVEGVYDIYTPGTYELSFYVIDSDGNQSNIEVLTLEVRN